jgi:hypothetical protein
MTRLDNGADQPWLSTSSAENRTLLEPWGVANLIQTTKKGLLCRPFLDSGGGIRTRDLRVMSPTSYLAAPPRGG